MARGESREALGNTSAFGVWAVLVVVVLFTLFLVALGLRGCGDDSMPVAVATPTIDVAFDALGDRDGYGNVATDTRETARARGYEVLDEASTGWREVPFVEATTHLADLCGVVLVTPDPTSRLEAIGVGDTLVHPADAGRPVSIAVCGTREVRALGIGRARLEYWVMPGLTPADVAATELPVEVALGFAEAESLLHSQGWRPTREVARIEVDPTSPRVELPRPSAGCVPWVVMAVGCGQADAEHAGQHVDADASGGRLMLGAISCADGGHVAFTNVATDGGVAYARPLEHGGGPRVPHAPGTQLTTVADVRVVPVDGFTLPSSE